MIGNHTVLAIIPARGGSSRIPGKNLKALAGKPLLQYTIDAAKASSYIDRTIIVTDDEAIGRFAEAQGIGWPFVEPAELADGTRPDRDYFEYALQWLEENEGYVPDIVVQLRPTSPLRTASHIDAALTLLTEHPEADSVRTVCEPEQSPYKMYALDAAGLLTPLLALPGVPEAFNLPGQALPKAYKHVGYVDALWRKTLMEKGQMTGDRIVPLVIPAAQSGINTPEDWERYEYLLRERPV